MVFDQASRAAALRNSPMNSLRSSLRLKPHYCLSSLQNELLGEDKRTPRAIGEVEMEHFDRGVFRRVIETTAPE